MKMKKSAERVALCGLLVALMLVLGYLESLIPIPGMPGVKLGLSNSLLIYALYLMNIRTALILMVLKVVLSGLMFGGLLVAHKTSGWRGRGAARWVLVSFGALLLAYVGSRFVFEVLLHRSVV